MASSAQSWGLIQAFHRGGKRQSRRESGSAVRQHLRGNEHNRVRTHGSDPAPDYARHSDQQNQRHCRRPGNGVREDVERLVAHGQTPPADCRVRQPWRRRHHYRRRSKELTELDVTTFLNLMVVLVPFLLITAVFSRLAVVELHLPSAAAGSNSDAPPFQLEVIVRDGGFELTNGGSVIASLPKVAEGYDLSQLGDYVYSLKQEYPDANSASVLMEPDIEYDHLIQVMDVVRAVEMPAQAAGGEPVMLALFDQISVGSAP